MKIIITCYPTYGGSGVVATELGKALAMRGHEIHFISYALPMRLQGFVSNIYYHEVESFTYPLFDNPMYTLTLTSKIVEVVKMNDIDLVHAHYAIPHAVSAFLSKDILRNEKKYKKDLKIITTLHGTDITLIGLEPSFLPLMKYSIEKSDGVTAVSNFLKEKTITSYQVEKNIEVIPNFIDLNKFKRISDKENSCFKKKYAPDNEKILMHTSNFRPLKRVQDVVKIFAEVYKKVPSKLLLIGDGPERSDTERLVREMDLTEKVIFMGKQDALVELLSIADLFIMPSQSESFGLSALEAMSCGVPVISSSIGGLPELNVHGESGYIAEIGDVDRMAKYAVDLLTNEKKYQLFSKQARERAEKFSEDNIVPMYENYYEKVLNGK